MLYIVYLCYLSLIIKVILHLDLQHTEMFRMTSKLDAKIMNSPS